MDEKLYLLIEYLKQNPSFDMLIVEKNSISLEGRVIDFTGFDIEKFLSESDKLISDIENLPIQDVFNIIKLHVDYANMIKKMEEEEANKMMDNFLSNNPSLRNFHIFKNIDADGFNKYFLKYTDEKGKSYILKDISAKEFMATYIELQDNGLEITESELFSTLASKYQQIKMENLFEAEKRIGVSEEHLNNLKTLQEQNIEHMENHNEVLGNEEYGIYLNNNQVITMGYNKKGEKLIENHGITTTNDESTLADDLVASYDEQQLITFEEYSNIIANSEELSNDDNIKINNFENFMFEVMTYKDYLTPDLYQVYQNFYKFWDYLASVKETTMVIEDAKYRYQDMQERSEKREASYSKKHVAFLQRRYDHTSSYGYVNAFLYAGVVIFIGIVIAVITVLAK